MSTRHSERRLAASRDEIARLLDRHRVLEAMAHQQDSPKRDLLEQLQHKQNVAELGKRLRTMHAADIAYVLESLPPEDRSTVWSQVAPEQAGDVFVESSDAVRRFIVSETGEDAMVTLLGAPRCRGSRVCVAVVARACERARLRRSRPPSARCSKRAFSTTANSVGYYMTREWVEVDERADRWRCA